MLQQINTDQLMQTIMLQQINTDQLIQTIMLQQINTDQLMQNINASADKLYVGSEMKGIQGVH